MKEEQDSDKICMVTGANAGIGRETARELVRLGCEVLMVCRSKERGTAAMEDIKRNMPRNGAGGEVHLLTADLASQSQIIQLADEVTNRFPRLNILVHNAAVYPSEREMTEDGVEKTFAVNHLAPFLLTHCLLDLIGGGAPARIVVVSCAAHKKGSIRFDDLYFEKAFSPREAYSQSKLANILFTIELAERLKGSGVTVNCLHPGTADTEIRRNMALIRRFISRCFSIPPARGARNSVYAATNTGLNDVTGRYFVNRRPVKPAKQALDEAVRKRLWYHSVELVQKTYIENQLDNLSWD